MAWRARWGFLLYDWYLLGCIPERLNGLESPVRIPTATVVADQGGGILLSPRHFLFLEAEGKEPLLMVTAQEQALAPCAIVTAALNIA
jgi:hypothetical protein